MSDWQDFARAEDDLSFTALESAVANVLQELAFMFADPGSDDEGGCEHDTYLRAKISFKGPMSGTMGLIFSQALCFELIANILGLESEEISEPDDAEDAFKELLNVICGQFLTAAFGSGLLFDLSIPSVEHLDLAAWERQRRSPDTTVILVEDEPVLFDLAMGD